MRLGWAEGPNYRDYDKTVTGTGAFPAGFVAFPSPVSGLPGEAGNYPQIFPKIRGKWGY
jgi:hypothetical protein